MDSGIPNVMLNQLCDYWINFLSVMDLIYNFEATIVDHDYIIEFLTSINYLSSSYNTSNYKTSVLGTLNTFSYVFENFRMVTSRPDWNYTILIWDIVASFCLNPFRSDFIYCVKADITFKYVTKVNWVIGIVTTILKFIDVNCTTCYFLCVSYHIQSSVVRLFLPHTYHHMHV